MTEWSRQRQRQHKSTFEAQMIKITDKRSAAQQTWSWLSWRSQMVAIFGQT